jgi:hypothetical protein
MFNEIKKTPVSMNNRNKNYKENQKKIQNLVKPFIGTEIDKTRNFSQWQGQCIWDSAIHHAKFDSDVFKVDLFGCLVAKNIMYSINSPNQKFAYDLEHIVSHSHCGKTDVGNGALLNSGINRNKRADECYRISETEYYGYKCRFGIDPENLLQELEDNLDYTCDKYNLLFIKTRKGIWTLDKKEISEKKNNYKNYSSDRKYKSFPKNLNVKVNNKAEIALAATTVAVVGVTVDSAMESCITGYNHGYYATRKFFGYNDIEKDTNLSDTQKTIKTIGTTVITTGIAISVAVIFSKNKIPLNK